MTVDVDVVEALEESGLELTAQREQTQSLIWHYLAGDFARRAKPDDSGYVKRPGAHPALMAAAVHLRRDSHAWSLRANIKCADSLRPVNLVRADRREVDPRLLDVDRNLANRLNGVAMEHDSFFFRDLADLGNRMKRADLVVGPHDRDEHGLVGDLVAHRVRLDHPVPVNRQICDCRLSGTLERAATLEHRLMLGDATDYVVAFVLVKIDDALDRQVVGLGRAA